MARIVLVAIFLLACVLPAAAQYPERPLTLLSGYPAGGMVDIVARLAAEGMKPRFPRGITVVNRSGAAGSLAMADVVAGRPDGYTVVLTPLSTLVIHAQQNELRYKTPDDYDPVINLVSFYPLLAVRPDAPWKTPQDFVAEAKANPEKLRVGTPGEGTSSHLNLEEFMRVTSTKMIHVPFQGWAQSAPALMGGHIEAIVAQPGEARPQVEARKMRALMVFQSSRHAAFPDAPTAKELGWDVANGIWFMLVAAKGTPTPVARYIHDAAKAAIEDPAFVAAMEQRGVDVDYRAGDKLRADLWREYKLHTAILRRIGMVK